MIDLYYLIPIGVLAGTNIAACVGWWRSYARAEWCDKARKAVGHQLKITQARSLAWRSNASFWLDRFGIANAQAKVAEDKLAAIKAKRSAATAKGNHTRALKAKALRDATTAQLDGEVQAKVRKFKVAA